MYSYDDSRLELPVKLKLRAEVEGFDLIFHIAVKELKISRHFKSLPMYVGDVFTISIDTQVCSYLFCCS